MKVHVQVDGPHGKSIYWLWCPACDKPVCIDSSWGWNGDVERPTFTPSLLTQGPGGVCHSFVTDGYWNYLADCTHDKASQSMPVIDLPEWFNGD